jgi:hypothetical protein
MSGKLPSQRRKRASYSNVRFEPTELVDGFGRRHAQTFDFVLDLQFSTLDLDDRDVIRGRMIERFVKLIFQRFVLTFQFRKMSLDRHRHLHLTSLWTADTT